jgi:hypothetical protein
MFTHTRHNRAPQRSQTYVTPCHPDDTFRYALKGTIDLRRELVRLRRCRPSAIVSAESFIFAHKAVIDAILATPPTPSIGLSADVSDFLKQFAVPEDLAPFDVGVGGRQILSVKPVVWLSPDGPKPGVCLIRPFLYLSSCCSPWPSLAQGLG